MEKPCEARSAAEGMEDTSMIEAKPSMGEMAREIRSVPRSIIPFQ